MKITFFTILVIFILIGCQNRNTTDHDPENTANPNFYQLAFNNSLDEKLRIKFLDSALLDFSSIKKDTIYLNLLLEKATLFDKIGLTDSAFYYDRKLFKNASLIGSKPFMAKGSRYLGIDFENRQQFDSSYYYYHLAKGYYQELKDSTKIGNCLLRQAMIQKEFGDFFGAKEVLVEAISYLDTLKGKRYLTTANDQLGTISRKLLNFDDAVNYHRKAINISENQISKAGYGNNLALVYQDQGENKKAKEIYSGLLQSSVLKDYPSRYARILHNYTYNRWKLGESGIYSDFIKALQIRKETEDRRGEMASYCGIGEFFLESQPIKSKAYLDSSIQVAKVLKMPYGELNALNLLMELKPNDIGYKDRYIFLKDSLYAQELKVKTQFAKMRYDDEQEKLRLAKLESETAMQQAQLARKRVEQQMVFIGVLVAAFAIVFFYYQNYKNQEVKRLQAIIDTENKLEKRLHNDLSADLFSVMTLIQDKREIEDEQLLDLLQSVYKRSRAISHDLITATSGEDFVKNFSNLIKLHQSDTIKIITKGIYNVKWEHLPMPKATDLFLEIKELLVNAKKHAKCSFVAFSFEQHGNRVVVKYSDNGIGLNHEQKQIFLSKIRDIPNKKTSLSISLDENFERGLHIQLATNI